MFISIITPARAFLLESEILLLLTGPISEAVQETVLLIRRGDNFVTADSLLIGCIAGASSGVMVTLAPSLGLTMNMAVAPLSTGYLFASGILACGMSLVSNATGMLTFEMLERIRSLSKKTPE